MTALRSDIVHAVNARVDRVRTALSEIDLLARGFPMIRTADELRYMADALEASAVEIRLAADMARASQTREKVACL